MPPRAPPGHTTCHATPGRHCAERPARADHRVGGGTDFYASPRLSADGKQLAFLAWDLPDMPWDSAALYVSDVRAYAACWAAPSASPAAMAAPSSSRNGDPMATSTLPGTIPAGAASTAGREGNRSRAWVRRRRFWRAQWVFGMRCFALHPDGRFAAVSSVARDPGSGNRPLSGEHAALAPGARAGGTHRRPGRRRQRLRGPGDVRRRDAGRHEARARPPASNHGTAGWPNRARMHQPRPGLHSRTPSANGVRHPLPRP